MNGSGALAYQDSWCCKVINCNKDQEIVGFRKHILPKSSQKNQKYQKTSLKKRYDSNKVEKQINKQTSIIQTKQCTPPKSSIIHRNIRPPQPGVLFQQLQTNVTLVPSAICIKYSPQKLVQSPAKINFVYNNKISSIRYQNLGVDNLQSFQYENKINHFQHTKSKTFNTTTHAQSGYRSSSPIQPCKSTQVTYRTSNNFDSWHKQPGLSRDFYIDETPICINNNKQEKKLYASLSSRRYTVFSISGESESQQSFVEDMQPLNFVKFNAFQSNKLIDEKQKSILVSLKTSNNL